MKSIDSVNNNIGQLLFDIAPVNAKMIMVKAQLTEEGDACDYGFDYIDSDDNQNWFIPDKNAGYDSGYF